MTAPAISLAVARVPVGCLARDHLDFGVTRLEPLHESLHLVEADPAGEHALDHGDLAALAAALAACLADDVGLLLADGDEVRPDEGIGLVGALHVHLDDIGPRVIGSLEQAGQRVDVGVLRDDHVRLLGDQVGESLGHRLGAPSSGPA